MKTGITIQRFIIGLLLVITTGLFCIIEVYAEEDVEDNFDVPNVTIGEHVIKYAWYEGCSDNYIRYYSSSGNAYKYSGLQDLSSKCSATTTNRGIDCSGFVYLAYLDYDIRIPLLADVRGIVKDFKDVGSFSVGTVSKSGKFKIVSEGEALPGDIMLFAEIEGDSIPQAHLSMFLGDGNMIHTHNPECPTSNGKELGGRIHIECFDGSGNSEKNKFIFKDTDYWKGLFKGYIRVIPAEEKGILGTSKVITLSGKTLAGEVSDRLVMCSSLVMQDELTGMPSESSLLLDEQYQIYLASLDDLDLNQKTNLTIMQENLDNNKMSADRFFNIVISFVGLCLIIYGVLLSVGIVFDKVNRFIDISAIGVLTLGRWCMVDCITSKENHKKYLSLQALVVRVIIILSLGILLISKLPLVWLLGALSYIKKLI